MFVAELGYPVAERVVREEVREEESRLGMMKTVQPREGRVGQVCVAFAVLYS